MTLSEIVGEGYKQLIYITHAGNITIHIWTYINWRYKQVYQTWECK